MPPRSPRTQGKPCRRSTARGRVKVGPSSESRKYRGGEANGNQGGGGDGDGGSGNRRNSTSASRKSDRRSGRVGRYRKEKCGLDGGPSSRGGGDSGGGRNGDGPGIQEVRDGPGRAARRPRPHHPAIDQGPVDAGNIQDTEGAVYHVTRCSPACR